MEEKQYWFVSYTTEYTTRPITTVIDKHPADYFMPDEGISMRNVSVNICIPATEQQFIAWHRYANEVRNRQKELRKAVQRPETFDNCIKP